MTHHSAYAARIGHDGIVRDVIVIPFMDDDDDKITAYCHSIGLSGVWLDCSYLGARRGKYPGIGDRYDALTDTFVSPTFAEQTE